MNIKLAMKIGDLLTSNKVMSFLLGAGVIGIGAAVLMPEDKLTNQQRLTLSTVGGACLIGGAVVAGARCHAINLSKTCEALFDEAPIVDGIMCVETTFNESGTSSRQSVISLSSLYAPYLGEAIAEYLKANEDRLPKTSINSLVKAS